MSEKPAKAVSLWEAKHTLTLPGPALLQRGALCRYSFASDFMSASTLTELCCPVAALAARAAPALQHLDLAGHVVGTAGAARNLTFLTPQLDSW